MFTLSGGTKTKFKYRRCIIHDEKLCNKSPECEWQYGWNKGFFDRFFSNSSGIFLDVSEEFSNISGRFLENSRIFLNNSSYIFLRCSTETPGISFFWKCL